MSESKQDWFETFLQKYEQNQVKGEEERENLTLRLTNVTKNLPLLAPYSTQLVMRSAIEQSDLTRVHFDPYQQALTNLDALLTQQGLTSVNNQVVRFIQLYDTQIWGMTAKLTKNFI